VGRRFRELFISFEFFFGELKLYLKTKATKTTTGCMSNEFFKTQKLFQLKKENNKNAGFLYNYQNILNLFLFL